VAYSLYCMLSAFEHHIAFCTYLAMFSCVGYSYNRILKVMLYHVELLSMRYLHIPAYVKKG